MKVREIMSHGVQTAQPEDSVRDVAQAMADMDVGALPVCEGQSMIGMITDRDIAIRVVAKGLSSGTAVHEVMTRDAEYCLIDDDVADVAHKMARLQVRRLPVIDEARRLVGIVALGDLALEDKAKRTGETLSDISQPGRH
jgi:CBS domain-containing protein